MRLDRGPATAIMRFGTVVHPESPIAAFDPVPPVGFGAIERAIGFRQQKIQIAGVAVRRCDANAHRHCERAACSSDGLVAMYITYSRSKKTHRNRWWPAKAEPAIWAARIKAWPQ